MQRKIISLFLIVVLVCFNMPNFAYAEGNDEIVILFENDVHCAVDGYAKLAGMKNELSETLDYVGVVSVGDYVQGSSLGAISKGEYIVNIMNMIGYDAVTLGNHEFDYKIPRLMELVDMMNTKPVCSNFQKIGEKESVFRPYTMVSYGGVDIAYVGITTPDTISSSSPAQFKDDTGEYIYTFNGNNLYEVVQKSIDAAKAEGAEYIVGLSHLGTENVYEEWSAQSLINNTEGFDVVLDGHSHSVVEKMIVKDKNNDDVIVASTGTKFANIGKLTITGDGDINTELIATETYEKTDNNVVQYIAQINEEYANLGNRKIGVSKVKLTTVDKDGNRIIRNAETNLGDLCADAYRVVTGADIGFINGGGIRADINEGDITFNDILSVYPFNNLVCVVEVTGQQIVDMLELGVINYPEENGSFQHVSGIEFNLDDSIASSVKLDENLSFIQVEGARRVSNVKVYNQETCQYEPIDLDKKYTLASHSYLLLEQGGGASMFKDAKVIRNDGMLDVELLEIYITEYLGGVVGEEYAVSQNRISIGKAQEEDKTEEESESEDVTQEIEEETETTEEVEDEEETEEEIEEEIKDDTEEEKETDKDVIGETPDTSDISSNNYLVFTLAMAMTIYTIMVLKKENGE